MNRGIKIAVTVALLGVFALSFQACGGSKAKNIAEQAAKVQLEAIKAEPMGSLNGLYLLLSTKDRDVITPENFQERYQLPSDLQEIMSLFPQAKEVFKVSDFKEVVTGERAEVMFSLEMPDPEKIGQDVLSLNDLLLISGERFKNLSQLPEEVKTKLQEHVAKTGVPTKKVAKTMTMVKEDGEWRLLLNLEETLPKGRIPTLFDLPANK